MNIQQQTNFMLWYSSIAVTIYGLYFIYKALEELRLSRKFSVKEPEFKELTGKKAI